MSIRTDELEHKIGDPGGPADLGYEEWKQRKIERSLAASKDRSTLISAEKVWRDLGLED